MPALVEAVRQAIERELEDRPVLVWYDVGAALQHDAEALATTGIRLLVYDGSFLALRVAFEEADPALRGQTILYVGRERPEPSWLRDLELAGSWIRLGLADVVCTGFGLATTARQRELLAGPVGRALGVRWDELLSSRPSASDLDLAMLAAALDLGAHPGLRDVVLQYIVQDDAPTRLERSGLQAELRALLEDKAGLLGLPEAEVPQRRVAAALLLSEAASQGAIAADQLGEAIPGEPHRTQWAAWAREWMRWEDDGAFTRWSDDVSQLYRIRDKLTGPTMAVAGVQAFRAVDDECVQRVESLVRTGTLDEAREVAELRRSTRWAKRAEAANEPLPWDVMAAALTLLRDAAAACATLDARTTWPLADLLARYASEWWRVDDAYRRLEARWSTAPRNLGELAVTPASRAYAHFLDKLAEVVADAVTTVEAWSVEGWSSPRETAVRHLGNGSRTALILADALRADLARVVVHRLQDLRIEVDEVATLAELPSVTQVGMAAIQAPGWNERELTVDGRTFAPKVGSTVLRSREDRLAALRARFPRAQAMELQAVNDNRTIPSAQPLVVYARAIDEQGDNLIDVQLDIFELLAGRVADATRRLLDHGYSTVVIIADHGFVLSPRDAPVPTVPAPRTDASTVRARRYAVGRPSDVAGAIRLPLLRLGWQDSGSALFPRGRGVFALPGETPRFFHGGLLPQETALLSLVCRRAASGMPPTDVRIVEPSQIVTTIPRFVLRGETDSLLAAARRVRVVVRVEGRVVAESGVIELGTGDERDVSVRLDRYGREVHAIVEDVESRQVVTEQIIPVELPAGYEDLDL
jgi:hypothetical protein